MIRKLLVLRENDLSLHGKTLAYSTAMDGTSLLSGLTVTEPAPGQMICV